MEVLRSLFGAGSSSGSASASAPHARAPPPPDEDVGCAPSLHALNQNPVVLELLVPYLEIKTVGRLREVGKGFRATVDGKGPRVFVPRRRAAAPPRRVPRGSPPSRAPNPSARGAAASTSCASR